ncbi:MAG: glycosyltransferase [Planctomycetota bacterium]|jgi:glycosyltransferase involved in cell wall biosynthesis
MHVLIDGRMLIGRFSGIGRFVTRLVDALSRRDGVEVSLLCGSSDGGGACGRDPLNGADRELRARLQQQGVGIETCSFSRRDRTALRRLIWEERNLPRVIARSGADVFHATWNSGVPIRCPVPAVLTIHDLIPWHAPRDHFYYRHDRWAYRSGVRWSARRARVITAVSEYSRAALVSTLGIDGSKTVTIHNGVDSRSLPRDEVLARPNQPYVLYVGGHQDRKNVAGVLRAMACYWSRHGESLELHLTGDEDSLCPTARTALSCPALTGGRRRC